MQSFVERRTFVATSRTRGFVVENLSSLNDSLYMFLIVNESYMGKGVGRGGGVHPWVKKFFWLTSEVK